VRIPPYDEYKYNTKKDLAVSWRTINTSRDCARSDAGDDKRVRDETRDEFRLIRSSKKRNIAERERPVNGEEGVERGEEADRWAKSG